MILGVFYLVVDVWRWQRWCAPFLWIGSNALFVYLAVNLVDFDAIAARLADGTFRTELVHNLDRAQVFARGVSWFPRTAAGGVVQAITHGVRVRVSTVFVPENSNLTAAQPLLFFVYRYSV